MTAPKPGPDLPDNQQSRLGSFIQTYSGFLSSFVIGLAGLVATSIWQYRQSKIAETQATSQAEIADRKAKSDWNIARAEILAKNLGVLAAQGPGAADQKYGVLLSLTRGEILDPELAVSYALELGKENASYMRSVLGSTNKKSYVQLASAFALTCMQRFGVEKNAAICNDDRLADRSNTIAQIIADEMQATHLAQVDPRVGPLSVLADEREVQASPTKLAWLFEPYLQDLYERRQWNDITRFERASVGARLVAALVLATARTGEMVSPSEAAVLEKFHGERRRWLTDYLFGRTCDNDCRAKLIDVMLSIYGESDGDFDEPLRKILRQSRAEGGRTFAALHARLLWCQMDAADLDLFRAKVLVPTVTAAIEAARTKPEATNLEDLVGLVALVPEPKGPGAEQDAWKAMLDALARTKETYARQYGNRRVSAARERASPPPMIQKVSFCGAADALPVILQP